MVVESLKVRARRTAVVFVCFASVLLTGWCLLGFSGCGFTECTSESFPGIEAVPVDSDGNALPGRFTFEYREEGDEDWTGCPEYRNEVREEPHAECAHSQTGTFEVRGTNGEVSGRTSGIDVGEDRCHTITERVDVLMQ
jgi:hypothetical protein